MSTCETCKWWSGQEECNSYGPKLPLLDLWGVCDNPKVNGKTPELYSLPDGRFRFYRTMVARRSADPEEVQRENVHDYVLEYEDDHAIPLNEAEPRASDEFGIHFITGPKFGCVHNEPKE